MPGLGARLSLLAVPPTPQLRLGARLRATLRPRLRRILRRWARRVTRIPPRLLLKPSDPLLQTLTTRREPLALARQPNDHSNASLPPRTKNRLRLRAVHTRKIRCTPSQSSLQKDPQLNAYGFGGRVVLDWYSDSGESTAGEYHIATYSARIRDLAGLQAGGCRFDPSWMGETWLCANHPVMAAPMIRID